MECKVRLQHFFYALEQDLIDTLWNVKMFQVELNGINITDLIDTLWNVKTTKLQQNHHPLGFNRYIVECKVIFPFL